MVEDAPLVDATTEGMRVAASKGDSFPLLLFSQRTAMLLDVVARRLSSIPSLPAPRRLVRWVRHALIAMRASAR